MIKAEFVYNVKFPKLDFTDTLGVIAGRFVNALRGYIDSETDLNENGYPPLSRKYVDWKRKKGLNTQILKATNQLVNSISSKVISKNKAEVFLRGGRSGGMSNSELGDILMNKGTGSGRKFNFFGVNERMEEDAIKVMEKAISEAIKNA
jgi:hypothetical protein